MKKYTFILLLIACSAMAQTKGNRNIVTQFITTETITDIETGLYADITIDQNAQEGIQITADSNLIPLIDTEVVDGTLKLGQIKWIQPSSRMKIIIGAPNIRRIQHGTNDVLKITNLDLNSLSLMALNGTMEVSGNVKTLRIGAENGIVNAGNVATSDVFLNIWGWGKVVINPADYLEAELGPYARLSLLQNPKKVKGDIKQALANARPPAKGSVKYINFKIKNNSGNRQEFYVIGPKPDGNKFSYGFPMPSGKIRKENWTTGTKVYKVGKLGLRKLLITIEASDENTTIDLF